MIFIPIVLIVILITAYLLYGKYNIKYKRIGYIKKHKKSRETWLKFISSNNQEILKSLSNNEVEKLLDYISIFISEKTWASSFDEQSKVLEAAKALRPLINRATNFYPQIKHIAEPKSFQEWLKIIEKQYQIEFGKANFREFKGRFPELASDYLLNPTPKNSNRDSLELKDGDKLNELLNLFFNKK